MKKSAWIQNLLAAQLGLWVVGCLTFEAFASAGLVGCFAAVLAWSLSNTDSAELFQRLRSWWPLVAFIAWGCLASAVVGRPPTGTGVARLMDFAGIPVAAVAWTLITPSQRRVVLRIGAGVFLLSCLVAVLQYFGVWPPLEFFAPFQWTRISFYRVYEAIPDAPGRHMAGGLLFHRLKFAHVGGLVVLMAFALGIEEKGKDRILAWVVAGIGLVSVALFPYARAAGAAVVLALIFFAIIASPKLGKTQSRAIWMACGLLIMGAVGLLLVNTSLRNRALSAATASGNGDRDKLLASGARAVAEFPVVGVGAGQFRPSRFPSPDMPESVLEHPGKTHNQFLTEAAELGIPGALLYLLMLGMLVRRIGASSLVACGAQACLAFFVLLSLAHDPLFHAPFSMGVALVLGAGMAPTKER